ncbi:MAG: hypothetical protein U9Q70_02320 [Chloroflexota bacterium]|nr:hypothetical protein [Chloroflexota bacterium]
MGEKKEHQEQQVVKMQKLRRAVKRIRRKKGEQLSGSQQSWFKRLASRLGLSVDTVPDEEK